MTTVACETSVARPKKIPTDRRTRKIVVWVTAVEQARYLVNAARAGLTGPDYIRAVACGSPMTGPRKSDAAIEMVLQTSPAERQALLARAGAAGETVERWIIARALAGDESGSGDRVRDFELVDALVRSGTTLQRLVDITTATGVVPDEVGEVVGRIERLLDSLLPT